MHASPTVPRLARRRPGVATPSAGARRGHAGYADLAADQARRRCTRAPRGYKRGSRIRILWAARRPGGTAKPGTSDERDTPGTADRLRAATTVHHHAIVMSTPELSHHPCYNEAKTLRRIFETTARAASKPGTDRHDFRDGSRELLEAVWPRPTG
jgi:hypothetical protein